MMGRFVDRCKHGTLVRWGVTLGRSVSRLGAPCPVRCLAYEAEDATPDSSPQVTPSDRPSEKGAPT